MEYFKIKEDKTLLCKCGAETKHKVHQIFTLSIARAWFPDVVPKDLPITVKRDVCTACGRQYRWQITGDKYEPTGTKN